MSLTLRSTSLTALIEPSTKREVYSKNGEKISPSKLQKGCNKKSVSGTCPKLSKTKKNAKRLLSLWLAKLNI